MENEVESSDIEQIFASGRRSRSNSVVQQKMSSRSEGTAAPQQQIPPNIRARLSLSSQGDKKIEGQTEQHDFRPMPKPRSMPPVPPNRKLQNVTPSEGLVPGSLTEKNETPPVHIYNDAVNNNSEMKNESMAMSLDNSEQQSRNDHVDSAPYPDTEVNPNQPALRAESEIPISDGDDNPENLSSASFAPLPSPTELLPAEADTYKETNDEPDQETTVKQPNSSSRAQLPDRGGQKDIKTRMIYSRDKRKDNYTPMTERTKLRDQLFESEERNRTLRQRLDKLSLKSEQLVNENVAIKRQLDQGLQTDHLISSLDQIGCLPQMLLPVLYAPWDPQQDLNADINSLAAKAKALESALTVAASVPQSHYDEFARSSFRKTPSMERAERRPSTTGRSERPSTASRNRQQSSNGPPVPRLQLTDRSVVPSHTKPEKTTNGQRPPSSTPTKSQPRRPRSSQSQSRVSQKSSNRPPTSSAYRPRRPSSTGPSQRTVVDDDHLESAPSISKKPVFAKQQSARKIAPFQPNNYLDVQPGFEAKFIRENGELDQGIIRYVGALPSKKEPYMGIELHLPNGKHDGMYRGRRYFNCSPNTGIFVPHSKIIAVWNST